MNELDYILEVEHLNKIFKIKDAKHLKSVTRDLRAVNDVSFKIKRGHIYGLVGESGCGKSTLGRCVLRLIEPTSGIVKFNNQDITTMSARDIKNLRKKMQIIFQNPYASMNPKRKIGDALTEVLRVNDMFQGKEKERITEIFNMVGVNPDALDKYPHQFSGGQLQRIAIARALLVEPEFIVADECVSALDVSVQAQVVNLLLDLKDKMNLTILFISHDLSIVEHISDEVGVMYLGRLVEASDVETIFTSPAHPYTKALMSAIPNPDPEAEQKAEILEGETPSPMNLPPGCPFYSRCIYSIPACMECNPTYKKIADGHMCACNEIKGMDYYTFKAGDIEINYNANK